MPFSERWMLPSGASPGNTRAHHTMNESWSFPCLQLSLSPPGSSGSAGPWARWSKSGLKKDITYYGYSSVKWILSFQWSRKMILWLSRVFFSEKALISESHYMQPHFNDPIAAKLSNKLCVYGLWTNIAWVKIHNVGGFPILSWAFIAEITTLLQSWTKIWLDFGIPICLPWRNIQLNGTRKTSFCIETFIFSLDPHHNLLRYCFWNPHLRNRESKAKKRLVWA